MRRKSRQVQRRPRPPKLPRARGRRPNRRRSTRWRRTRRRQTRLANSGAPLCGAPRNANYILRGMMFWTMALPTAGLSLREPSITMDQAQWGNWAGWIIIIFVLASCAVGYIAICMMIYGSHDITLKGPRTLVRCDTYSAFLPRRDFPSLFHIVGLS